MIVTVDIFEEAVASFALYVNVSVKFAEPSCVYEKVPSGLIVKLVANVGPETSDDVSDKSSASVSLAKIPSLDASVIFNTDPIGNSIDGTVVVSFPFK